MTHKVLDNQASRRGWAALFLMILLIAFASQATAKGENGDDEPEILPLIAEKTEGWKKRSGFFDFYVEERHGKIWLELPPPQGERRVVGELLYVSGLLQGLGSNPIGLDRGQLAESRVLEIRRLGPRVLFEEPNLGYRALTTNPAERRATRQSFASSVIWGGKIGALDPDGRALVDLTSFLVRDAHGVRDTLRDTGQGSFELDEDRSAVDLGAALGFPDNLELEAVLTFTSHEPGAHVENTVPLPQAITLVQHHSLIRLPDDDYQLRAFDPRIGVNAIDFQDYAAAIDKPLIRRFVVRHRLTKDDPIVFYVDPGAPEPVRSALVEGAGWWAEAFAAAGFPEGYRVEILPEDAHPLDVRYNVIQWVHRSTRGWSYGGGIVDPRTGEFMKGHVSLGSLRVRQDRLLFEGLAGVGKTGSDSPDDPVQMALWRIRQLAAHEVGHALGLTHNFAASTYDGRASVMDYPAPLIDLGADGDFDFSRVYGIGIGSWDVQCIRYAYSQFSSSSDEAAGLASILEETLERHVFVADRDARPAGASDPRGNLWDNGTDPVAEFEKALEIRRRALESFGSGNIAPGRPLAALQEVLAPVYFHHRYQQDAVAKMIGGMEANYALRGDGQTPTRILTGERQRAALRVLLAVLDPAVLDLPEDVLLLLAPRPFEWQRSREMFGSATAPAFDALGAAATAADEVVEAVVQPERLARVDDFHRRDSALPSVGEVLASVVDQAMGGAEENPRHLALRRVIERTVIDRLIATAGHPSLRPALRAEIELALRGAIDGLIRPAAPTEPAARAHVTALANDVSRFLSRSASTAPAVITAPAAPPPGSPIGGGLGFGSSLGFEGCGQQF